MIKILKFKKINKNTKRKKSLTKKLFHPMNNKKNRIKTWTKVWQTLKLKQNKKYFSKAYPI